MKVISSAVEGRADLAFILIAGAVFYCILAMMAHAFFERHPAVRYWDGPSGGYKTYEPRALALALAWPVTILWGFHYLWAYDINRREVRI